jgi:Ca-activated chloride channel family protein
VLDKKKNFITGLRREDFAIFEDGKPQEIAFFSTELDELIARPLAVMFLLDASGSAAQTIRQQRAATQTFLGQLSDRQAVAVTRFSQTPELLIDFTTDKQKITQAFSDHDAVGGDTAIFDALDFAVDRLGALAGEDATRRKVVILISDGLDNASRKDYKDVAAKAEAAGVSFYIVHLPLFSPGPSGHLEPRPTTPGFTAVADLTGGQLFVAGDVQSALSVSQTTDLTPIFRKIINELRSQYYIGYYPPNPKDGKYHRLSVRVQQRDARPRVLRRGYVAK